jgi:hypothetical protein
LVSLEVLMTGRQTMMAWGDPRLLLQLQVFPTATSSGTIIAKRRKVRTSSWENTSPYITLRPDVNGKFGKPQLCAELHLLMGGKLLEVWVSGLGVYAKLPADTVV